MAGEGWVFTLATAIHVMQVRFSAALPDHPALSEGLSTPLHPTYVRYRSGAISEDVDFDIALGTEINLIIPLSVES